MIKLNLQNTLIIIFHLLQNMIEYTDPVSQHFDNMNLDVRVTRFSRFTDQKNTPDVLSFIAGCIYNYLNSDTEQTFTVKNIWESEYFINNVKFIFGKPDPTTNSAREYDKFINQPMRLLDYAKILSSETHGVGNVYRCIQPKILFYISVNESNSFHFLYEYLNKVMSDSGFLPRLHLYKDNPTSAEFISLKTNYQQFILGNTNIKTTVEINRIFPKLINIFAVSWNIPGSVDGKISENIFYFNDLRYNRTNFRDVGKPKQVPRQSFSREQSNEQKTTYFEQRAKKVVNDYHIESEIQDHLAVGEATQIHHIFSISEYPQFRTYPENMIKLTATQHNTKAHPHNKTYVTDLNYQIDLLIAKSQSIERALQIGNLLYDKEQFIKIINEGLGLNIGIDVTFYNLRDAVRNSNLN